MKPLVRYITSNHITNKKGKMTMKTMKKLAGLLIALAMMVCMCAMAFATDTAKPYSITVTNSKDSISMKGNTYKAYKLFDVTQSGDNYSYTVAKEFTGFSYNDKTGDALIEAVSKLSGAEIDEFAKAALIYATDSSIAPKGEVTADAESATINLEQAGYYLVAGTATATSDNKTTVTAACALDTTNPKADVIVKADAPSVDKNIVGKNDTDKKPTKAENGAIGDKIKYAVTSKVPSMQGYTKYYFVVNDTMSKGLTFNDDVTIQIGGAAPLTKDTDYTVTSKKDEKTGVTAIEIVFKSFIQYKDKTDEAITINYSATVNEDAVIGDEGNPNTVKLTYSNNPNTTVDHEDDKPKPGEAVGETPESTTKTYVTDLKIVKTDKDGTKLDGAEFDIEGTALNTTIITEEVFKEDAAGEYYKLKDGTYTKIVPVTAEEGKNDQLYDSITTKYKKVEEKRTVTKEKAVTKHIVVNGETTITGLSEGIYTITETKAPAGYNKLDKPIKLTITWKAEPAEGEKMWTYAISGADGATITEATLSTNTVTVVNESGNKLPSTGGIGTTIFYVLGSLLAIGAAIILVAKKRMSMR